MLGVELKSNFAENLKKLRKQRGLTLEELAEQINQKYGTSINKSMISKWERGGDAELNNVKYLSLFFDVSINELLGFNLEIYDKKQYGKIPTKIPIVSKITDGQPVIKREQILGYAAKPPLSKISDKLLGELFYLKVNDDSMNLKYPKDSIVLVRKHLNITSGDDVVLLVENEKEALIRNVKFHDDIVELIPFTSNSEYETRKINQNETIVQFIGKVIGVWQQF